MQVYIVEKIYHIRRKYNDKAVAAKMQKSYEGYPWWFSSWDYTFQYGKRDA